MAIRIDIDRTYLTQALEQKIASLRRSIDKQPNIAIKQLVEKDIAIFTTAMNTMTDSK